MAYKQIALTTKETVLKHSSGKVIKIDLNLEPGGDSKPFVRLDIAMGEWNGSNFTAIGQDADTKAIEDLPAATKTKITALVNALVADFAALDKFKGSAENEPA